MIRIGILGDIGSGKSFVAKKFGYPVFNADYEVAKLYKKDRKIYRKLKKVLPNYVFSFPVNKNEITKAILANRGNLKKIIKIVHFVVRKKLNNFLSKNKSKKFVILDIPLLLETKMNKKEDILIFVKTQKTQVLKRLKKRKNFNQKLLYKFNNIQLPLDYKKKKSHFIIKNDFIKVTVIKYIKNILNEITK